MPYVDDQVKKFERVIAKVRQSSHGQPAVEVRRALVDACESENLVIWGEVLDDAARLIAGEGGGGSTQS